VDKIKNILATQGSLEIIPLSPGVREKDRKILAENLQAFNKYGLRRDKHNPQKQLLSINYHLFTIVLSLFTIINHLSTISCTLFPVAGGPGSLPRNCLRVLPGKNPEKDPTAVVQLFQIGCE